MGYLTPSMFVGSIWGVTCVQTFMFFTQELKDGPLLKATVRPACLSPGSRELKLLLDMSLDCFTLVSV